MFVLTIYGDFGSGLLLLYQRWKCKSNLEDQPQRPSLSSGFDLASVTWQLQHGAPSEQAAQHSNIWGFPVMGGTPIAGCFIMENPIKMDDGLGVPL